MGLTFCYSNYTTLQFGRLLMEMLHRFGFILNRVDFKGGNHIWAGEVDHRPFQIAVSAENVIFLTKSTVTPLTG